MIEELLQDGLGELFGDDVVFGFGDGDTSG